MDEAIFYKETQDAVFVRARGHITAALCADLKSRVFSRLDDRTPIASIHIDLTECDYMDSTFMGLIVGFKKRLSASPGSSVNIYGPNAVCQGLLKGIGLTRLVNIVDEPIELPPFMENIAGTQKATAEFLLDAHENLMEINDENKSKFATLSKILKDQIGGPANGTKT